MTRLHRWLVGLVAALVCGACGGEYTQSSIDPATDFAETIHGLYTSVFWWTVFILALVWGILGYVLVRFRERPGAPLPKQTHGHLGIEIAWTLGPALIVIAIAVPTIQALFRTQSADPEGGYVIDVVGHQFWWEFRYPEGVVTANELHLPVGRPVSLRLHSADVIHSFWVPQLGGKRDVNPQVQRPGGAQPRYNWLYFTVLEPGVYSGQCAEFCGPSHSLMGTRVVAESEPEFQGWLAAWAAGSPLPAPDSAGVQEDPVARGRQLFQTGICVACHAIQGTPAASPVGPNLTLFGRRGTIDGWLENTEDNLVRWIMSPTSVKPGVQMPGVGDSGLLNEAQVRDIAAYLRSLR